MKGWLNWELMGLNLRMFYSVMCAKAGGSCLNPYVLEVAYGRPDNFRCENRTDISVCVVLCRLVAWPSSSNSVHEYEIRVFDMRLIWRRPVKFATLNRKWCTTGNGAHVFREKFVIDMMTEYVFLFVCIKPYTLVYIKMVQSDERTWFCEAFAPLQFKVTAVER